VEEGFREMCSSSDKERVALVLQEKKEQETGQDRDENQSRSQERLTGELPKLSLFED
jgi:hypothetical protein